jgi:hypothetical protein
MLEHGSSMNKIPVDTCCGGHTMLTIYFRQCNILMIVVIIFPIMFPHQRWKQCSFPPTQTVRKKTCIYFP